MLSSLIFLIGSMSIHMAAALVVNENTCDASWTGYLDWGSGSIDLHLDSSATVSVKTCDSSDDTYVSILDSSGYVIANYDDDNCGWYSFGTNEDLLLNFAAGHYEIKVYSLWAHYDQYSLEVAIIGCDGNEASNDADVHSLDEDSALDFEHPLSGSVDVVDDDNCHSLWEGRVGDAFGEAEIGISLTETTKMWLLTCGSEMDTQIELRQHFAEGADQVIQLYSDDNCESDVEYYGATVYMNEDVSVDLEPGHYTVRVVGNGLWFGDHATLEVYMDHCTEHWMIAVIIGVVVGTLCFCICIIVALAYCCGCCCFKATEAAVKAMQAPAVEGNGAQSYGQSPGSQVQMLQMQPQYAQVVQQQPQYAQAAQQQPPQYAVQQQQAQFVQPQAAAAAQQLSVPQQPALVQQCVYTSD